MRHRVLALVTMLAVFFLVSAPLSAHHGVAAYDATSLVTVKGVVTDYEFINPHVLISVEARDSQGKVRRWEAELSSANMLTRGGWAQTTIKVGDEITLIGFRSKTGATSLRLKKILGTDGKALPKGSTGALDGGWHC